MEVDILTEGGVLGRADVPVGRSTGTHEAVELRDGGSAYGGRGVASAVRNVNRVIAPALKGVEVTAQREIDEIMIRLDGYRSLTSSRICLPTYA